MEEAKGGKKLREEESLAERMRERDKGERKTKSVGV